MAKGLIVQAMQQRYLGGFIPVDATEYDYWINGKDPHVQLFNISPEQETKVSPNHSDYLRWRVERLVAQSETSELLTILHEAYD